MIEEATRSRRLVQFELPCEIVEKVDQLAKADRRSRASWLRVQIDKAIQAKQTEGLAA